MAVATPVIAPVRPIFRALVATVVPEAAALDASGWAEVESIVEEYLSRRPAPLRRQLRSFMRVLEVLPLVRHGRTFTALDAARRLRFLRRVQDSPVLLVRRGFWGLRTMVYLGYYSRRGASAEIGYRAHVRGWQVRRAGVPADQRRRPEDRP